MNWAGIDVSSGSNSSLSLLPSHWGLFGHPFKYLIPPTPKNLFPVLVLNSLSFIFKIPYHLLLSVTLYFIGLTFTLPLLQEYKMHGRAEFCVLFISASPRSRKCLMYSRGSQNICWRGMGWMVCIKLSSCNMMIYANTSPWNSWITWEYLLRMVLPWPL